MSIVYIVYISRWEIINCIHNRNVMYHYNITLTLHGDCQIENLVNHQGSCNVDLPLMEEYISTLMIVSNGQDVHAETWVLFVNSYADLKLEQAF